MEQRLLPEERRGEEEHEENMRRTRGGERGVTPLTDTFIDDTVDYECSELLQTWKLILVRREKISKLLILL